MDSIIEFLVNAQGTYDLGSLIKLFGLMIGMDGIILTIYSIVKGFNGR